MTMEIRRLNQNDGTLLKSALRALLSLGDHVPNLAQGSHLANALADQGCYFILCYEGSKVLGYLSAFRFPDIAHDGYLVYLYDIVVRPRHRRCGIGAKLIAALKQNCRADKVTRIWAGTSLHNRPAQAMFETTGAERVSDTYAEYVYDMGGGPSKGAV